MINMPVLRKSVLASHYTRTFWVLTSRSGHRRRRKASRIVCKGIAAYILMEVVHSPIILSLGNKLVHPLLALGLATVLVVGWDFAVNSCFATADLASALDHIHEAPLSVFHALLNPIFDLLALDRGVVVVLDCFVFLID